MAVLFLQSPYSFLFRDIAKEFLKNDIKCYAITFNLGDKYLYKGINTINAHSRIKSYIKEPIDNLELEKIRKEVKNIKNMYVIKKEKILDKPITEYEKRYFYSYIRFLEEIISEKGITKIIMQNDLRWQHALAIYVAKKNKINYYVFELGLFRPNTITIDTKGVNNNNSVPRDPNFYKSYKKINNSIDDDGEIESIRKNELVRNFNLINYILLYRLGEYLKINSIENKKITINDYFKRFLYTYFKRNGNKKKQYTKIPERYIFVPLQVNDDTQILVHSDYKNMNEFMEDIIDAVTNYNNKHDKEPINIVFKEHPMDIGKSNYSNLYLKYKNHKNLYFLNEGDTKSLIANCELLITINSTVGLEALEAFKRVISLGNAFYNINGIVKKSNPSNLSKDIEDSLSTPVDKELIENFIHFLKNEYQIKGDEYYYSENTIKRIVKKIL